MSFDTKGGELPFAASASHPSRVGESRHSGNSKLRLALRRRKFAASPLYRISVTGRMAAITREPKTFNNCLGFELGLWQRQNM
jgi:hypothetical protein